MPFMWKMSDLQIACRITLVLLFRILVSQVLCLNEWHDHIKLIQQHDPQQINSSGFWSVWKKVTKWTPEVHLPKTSACLSFLFIDPCWRLSQSRHLSFLQTMNFIVPLSPWCSSSLMYPHIVLKKLKWHKANLKKKS